jgi:hypothetical protein
MSDDGGLRGLFTEHLPDFHWVPIETGGTGRGVPDSNYCCDNIDGWIEFKQTRGYAVTLRPEQIGWLQRRAKAGGLVHVGVRRWNDRGDDELWLLAGAAASVIRQQGLRRGHSYVCGVWDGGPARWDWNIVRRLLLRRVA